MIDILYIFLVLLTGFVGVTAIAFWTALTILPEDYFGNEQKDDDNLN